MGEIDEEPRSFHLSRGRSDLPTLFFVLLFGVILIVSPKTALWVIRVILVAVAVGLFYFIRLERKLRGVLFRRSSPWNPFVALLGAAVLGIWIWKVVRVFASGNWIEAAIFSVLIAEFAYLIWFRARHGAASR